jgi:hypothetical protein
MRFCFSSLSERLVRQAASGFLIALAALTLAAGAAAEEFAAHIKRELARWAKVIDQAHIRPE